MNDNAGKKKVERKYRRMKEQRNAKKKVKLKGRAGEDKERKHSEEEG